MEVTRRGFLAALVVAPVVKLTPPKRKMMMLTFPAETGRFSYPNPNYLAQAVAAERARLKMHLHAANYGASPDTLRRILLDG